MKKTALLLGILMLLTGCKDSVVEAPQKPIDEETMANILYDLSVYEAMKSKKPGLFTGSTSDYVYKKYHIDSLQFAQNNRYYASEISKYQKIYENVNARLLAESKLADSLAKVKGDNEVKASSGSLQIK